MSWRRLTCNLCSFDQSDIIFIRQVDSEIMSTVMIYFYVRTVWIILHVFGIRNNIQPLSPRFLYAYIGPYMPICKYRMHVKITFQYLKAVDFGNTNVLSFYRISKFSQTHDTIISLGLQRCAANEHGT